MNLITQAILTAKYIIVHVCSLLSSCSSFRDSTFDDQAQNENAQEDIAELNGISKKFKGIFVKFCFYKKSFIINNPLTRLELYLVISFHR